MRGPGLKLDLDVRRVWTCPACGKQRHLPGDVTSPLCPCRGDGVAMQLTADSRLLRRAERLTPLPYIKRPPAAPSEEPGSTEPPSTEPVFSEPVAEKAINVESPEPANEPPPMDDFGAALDLPPESPTEPDPA